MSIITSIIILSIFIYILPAVRGRDEETEEAGINGER